MALAEVVPPDESDLWIEVAPDEEMAVAETVAVAVVLDVDAVALVVADQSRALGLCVVAIDVQVLEEREVRIETVRLVAADAVLGDRAVRGDHPDRAAA
jgi:hypothetical protein